MESEEEETVEYDGGKDTKGLPHGRGTLTFTDTGTRFEGRFIKGDKTGRGCFYFPDGSSLLGTYVAAVLEGKGLYSYSDGRTMVAQWINGKLNGPFTEYNEDGSIALEGNHQDDKRTGYLKVFYNFGAISWGKVDEQETLTGPDILYVYPDYHHILVGQFSDGMLQQAHWAHLNCSINDPIPIVSLDTQNNESVYYDKSTYNCLSKYPLVSDKYEQDKAYVSKSSMINAGEGLFANKYVSEGTVVSFYNGIRLSHEEVDSRDWSLNEYTITLDDHVVLDVPNDSVTLDKYCATLGHKANHSSHPNCEYVLYDHPRFGEIKAIQAICDVNRNTELTCDYAYCHKHMNTGEDDLPTWFEATQ